MDHSTTPEELLMEIEKVFSENKLFQSNFQEVTIIYSTPIYSLVPASLFDETKASEYLKFNSKILANDFIAYDSIDTQDLVIVYVPFVNINNYFFERFGTFSYYHSATVLLKTVLNLDKYSLPSKVFLHFENNTFDCVIIKNGELQLCNSYSYKTPEDFIYYTLFCLEQLKLNPEIVDVYLCGSIDETDENYQMAYTYIRNIKFLDTNASKITISETAKPRQHFILKNAL